MRFLLGLIVGVVFVSAPLWAYRTEQPPTFTDLSDPNQLTQLNNILLQLWNVLNGRVALNVTTTDPDGSLLGDKGQPILYDPGDDEQLCINVGGTNWDCVALTP